MKNWLKMSLPMVFMSSALLADGADVVQPAGKNDSFMSTLVMIGVALLFFYFILWRPEQKRRKAMEAQRNSLKKGDRVTAMGIVGTIAKVTDGNTLVLRMYDGSQIEVLKAAISDVKPSTDTADATEIEVTPTK